MLAMLKVSIEESIPVVERLLEVARDRDIRNLLSRRLAMLDQRLAAVSEKLAVGI